MSVFTKVTGAELRTCPDCGSEHMGRPCGMTAVARMRTVQLDGSWMPAKSKHNYYDTEMLDDLLGEDRHERMMEETKGVGPISEAELAQYRDQWGDEIDDFYASGPEVDDPWDEEYPETGDIDLG